MLIAIFNTLGFIVLLKCLWWVYKELRTQIPFPKMQIKSDDRIVVFGATTELGREYCRYCMDNNIQAVAVGNDTKELSEMKEADEKNCFEIFPFSGEAEDLNVLLREKEIRHIVLCVDYPADKEDLINYNLKDLIITANCFVKSRDHGNDCSITIVGFDKKEPNAKAVNRYMDSFTKHLRVELGFDKCTVKFFRASEDVPLKDVVVQSLRLRKCNYSLHLFRNPFSTSK